MVRGKYSKISQIDRQRIVDWYNQNQEFIKLAGLIDIKPSTARNVIKVYLKEQRIAAKARGGSKPRKLDREQIQSMVKDIEETPTATLKLLR